MFMVAAASIERGLLPRVVGYVWAGCGSVGRSSASAGELARPSRRRRPELRTPGLDHRTLALGHSRPRTQDGDRLGRRPETKDRGSGPA
jgi:hypothetical protein